MKFYSTNNKSLQVDLATAVLQSLPQDKGLYMPVSIPDARAVVADIQDMSLAQIAIAIATPFLEEDFSPAQIRTICEQRIDFPAPVITLSDHLHVLELWHGPSLAFKDFGARFMAGVMSNLAKERQGQLTILVATSGDTGGAVASGFIGVDGVEVVILYPSGKVSPLQEKQLTTHGQNITALEISGTFDDCQALVKRAFHDPDINKKYLLSSANSINIARLIPQTFYYFEAYRQLSDLCRSQEVVFSVPSGNYGNLTAGILAQRMGLPIRHFIAATNVNDIVPSYLTRGIYEPKPSIPTISNAMDIGDPSNFRRIEHLYDHQWSEMKESISGYSYDDETTRRTILSIKQNHNYIMDPHGAIAYLAARDYQKNHAEDEIIVLETAHPAKFLPVMSPLVGDIDIPERLARLSRETKVATQMTNQYESFKSWMLAR